MEYRGVGIRFVAALIDGIALAIVGYVVSLLFFGGGLRTQSTVTLVPGIIGFIYFIWLEAEYGQTLGKMATGIKVVKTDGGEMDWKASAIRNVMRIVDALPFLYLIGAIAIWMSDKDQRLGDMVADTVVVSA